MSTTPKVPKALCITAAFQYPGIAGRFCEAFSSSFSPQPNTKQAARKTRINWRIGFIEGSHFVRHFGDPA
jgi:hypothetical protein